jgi:hypothetical protein
LSHPAELTQLLAWIGAAQRRFVRLAQSWPKGHSLSGFAGQLPRWLDAVAEIEWPAPAAAEIGDTVPRVDWGSDKLECLNLLELELENEMEVASKDVTALQELRE